MTVTVGLTFSVGDYGGLRSIFSKTIRIGDAKYHI